MSALSFRPYLPKDAEATAELFVASIMELGPEEYSADQCAAWASAAEDVAAFGNRLAGMLTILAEAKGELVGFASLRDDPKTKDNKQLDMLYVAPEHAGHGIGKALLDVMELLARQRGAEALTADASEVARAFFVRFGYEMQARNTVMRADEWLVNTTMKKSLKAESHPLATPKANA